MNIGKLNFLASRKKNENCDPIVYREQENKPQHHYNYLGVMTDSKLIFHEQLTIILSNISKAIRSIYLIRYPLPLKAELMLFKSLVLSYLTFGALFYQILNFSAMHRVNRQINWGTKVCNLRKKLESSRDFLVKPDILPAEIVYHF